MDEDFQRKRIASSSLQIGQLNPINSRIEFFCGKRVFNDWCSMNLEKKLINSEYNKKSCSSSGEF